MRMGMVDMDMDMDMLIMYFGICASYGMMG